MRGFLANEALQVNAVVSSYENAIRTGNTAKLETLRTVNKDCSYLFDRADKTISAEV